MSKKIKVVFVFAVVAVFGLVFTNYYLSYNSNLNGNTPQAMSLAYTSSNEPVKSPEGYYVRTKFNNVVPDSVIASPDVDGVYLNFYWESISKANGVYDWTSFDENILKIANSGKYFKIGGAMQDRMPAWIKQSLGNYSVNNPDGYLTFTEFRKNGTCPGGDKVITFDIAKPWSAKYQNYVDTFINDLSNHLRLLKTNDGKDVYSYLTGVEFSYMQRDTSETRLTSQSSIKNCSQTATSTDAPQMWKEAGYTTEKILTAHNKMMNKLFIAFPGVSVVNTIVPKSFPDIKSDGQIVSRDDKNFVDINYALISNDIANFGNDPSKKIIYKWDSFNGDMDSNLLLAFKNSGGAIGGQPEENNWGDVILDLCPSTCNSSIANTYKAIADAYSTKGVLFMEGFWNNVEKMPSATMYMHDKLNVAPSEPKNLKGSYTKRKINLEWDKSIDNSGYVYYEIYNDQTLLGLSFENSAEINDVRPDRKYYFRVVAKDLNGNASPKSNSILIDSTKTISKPKIFNKNPRTTETIPVVENSEIFNTESVQEIQTKNSIENLIKNNPEITLPVTTTSMKFGNMGINIKILEAFMIDSGFCDPAKCKLSGYFGDDLSNAVIGFQQSNTINADATVGKATINKINQIYREKTNSLVDLFIHVAKY